ERPNDPVRLEVEAAIAHNIKIVPLLVGCARAVDAARVPASVNQIASLNAIRVTNDMFDDCMSRLTRTLEPLIGSPERDDRPARKRGKRGLLVGALAATGTGVTE